MKYNIGKERDVDQFSLILHNYDDHNFTKKTFVLIAKEI